MTPNGRRRRGMSATLLGMVLAAAAPARAQPEAPTPATPSPPPPGPVEPPDALFLDPAITGEAILIFDERPDKPFDRDTELRLTGDELRRRGATSLAEALELLPDVVVRAAGRGGEQIEIRGARKGSVKVLIDGVSISDPYYGNLDVAAIPITDVEQIRVSTSPASPIDGVGGPGGVIEIHTRDALGARLVRGHVVGSTLPTAEAAATARAAIGHGFALRASASGTLGMRDFAVADREVAEARRREVIALRLERRRAGRRLVADLWLQEGGYVAPPGDDGDQILDVDGERQGRVGVQLDDAAGRTRVLGRAFVHVLSRDSAYYDDAGLDRVTTRESLLADRAGLGGLVSRPLGASALVVGSLAIESEHAEVDNHAGRVTGGRASTVAAALGAQLGEDRFDLDLAIGAAVPFGIDAEPWPEAKFTARYRPAAALGLTTTLAHKGRTPTLRERFQGNIGNASLGPEKVSSAEVEVALTPHPAARLRVTPWLKQTSGLVRFDGDRAMLINTGVLDLRGIELELHARPGAPVGGGASYAFTDVFSAELGADPLDFMPRHRATGWLDGRLGQRLSGRTRLRYQSKVIDREFTLPGRVELDLSAWTRLGPTLSAALRVDNALDRRYDVRAGVAAPGRVVVVSLDGTLD